MYRLAGPRGADLWEALARLGFGYTGWESSPKCCCLVLQGETSVGQRTSWCTLGCVRAGVCARVCTGRVPGRLPQRLLCGRLLPVQKPVWRLPFAGSTRTPGSSAQSIHPCPPPPLLPSVPNHRAPSQPAGAGSTCQVVACRPPGPRAGEGERGREGAGVRRVGGGRGRAGRGVLAWRPALGAASSAALLPEAAAAPRPAPPCLLAVPGRPGCSDPRRGGGARK